MNLTKLSIVLAATGVFAFIAGWVILSVTLIVFSTMSTIVNFGSLPKANKMRKDSIVIISLMLIALIFAIATIHIMMILTYLVLFLYVTGKILILSKTYRKELIDSGSSDIQIVFGEMYGPITIISTIGFILAFGALREYLLAVFIFIILLAEIFLHLVITMPEKKQKKLLNQKMVRLLLFISSLLMLELVLTQYYIGLIAVLLIIILSIGYCIYKAYRPRND